MVGFRQQCKVLASDSNRSGTTEDRIYDLICELDLRCGKIMKKLNYWWWWGAYAPSEPPEPSFLSNKSPRVTFWMCDFKGAASSMRTLVTRTHEIADTTVTPKGTLMAANMVALNYRSLLDVIDPS